MARKADPELRRKIIEQAEHLIHLSGYHRTSLDEIAKACSMTKANLFHHFLSKEELGLAVLESKMADYRSRRVGPLCGCGDPILAVQKMFQDCARFYDGNGCRAGCFVGNIALEMSDINEVFRKRVGAFFESWVKDLTCCLDRAKKAGQFSEGFNSRAGAETILALYEGAVMQARTRRDASIFLRVGLMARKLLESQRKTVAKRRKHGPQDTLRVLNPAG